MVPTVTYKVLFVLVILVHERRRIVHCHVTEHPTAAWTAQQVVDAFPWDEAPRYLLRDRDRIYGDVFRQLVRNKGIEEVLIAPRSPWQNPYVERVIGSIRRELLDQVIVLNKRHLTRLLQPLLRATIIAIEPIERWTWTHLSLAACNRPNSAACGRSQRWVACTITTNGSRREHVPSKSCVFSCYGISGPTVEGR